MQKTKQVQGGGADDKLDALTLEALQRPGVDSAVADIDKAMAEAAKAEKQAQKKRQRQENCNCCGCW